MGQLQHVHGLGCKQRLSVLHRRRCQRADKRCAQQGRGLHGDAGQQVWQHRCADDHHGHGRRDDGGLCQVCVGRGGVFGQRYAACREHGDRRMVSPARQRDRPVCGRLARIALHERPRQCQPRRRRQVGHGSLQGSAQLVRQDHPQGKQHGSGRHRVCAAARAAAPQPVEDDFDHSDRVLGAEGDFWPFAPER